MGRDHFRHLFREIREEAAKACPSLLGNDELDLPIALFIDLRDTGITRLALAQCTLDEICSWSGHTRDSAMRILRHYIDLNAGFADSAADKLIAYLEQEKIAAGENQP